MCSSVTVLGQRLHGHWNVSPLAFLMLPVLSRRLGSPRTRGDPRIDEGPGIRHTEGAEEIRKATDDVDASPEELSIGRRRGALPLGSDRFLLGGGAGALPLGSDRFLLGGGAGAFRVFSKDFHEVKSQCCGTSSSPSRFGRNFESHRDGSVLHNSTMRDRQLPHKPAERAFWYLLLRKCMRHSMFPASRGMPIQRNMLTV